MKMTTKTWLLRLAVLASLAGCGAEPPPPPDVVVILIDTLRPDHLPFYGYDAPTAPFLGRLAARSTVFTRAWSTSGWTPPSTASLFTSLYPVQHGVLEGFNVHRFRVELRKAGGESPVLPLNAITPAVATLPEMFQERGYRTYGVAANINIGEEMGFRRGFDHFIRVNDAPAPELFAELKRFTDKDEGDGPRFFYLHFNDVHEPYQRRAPWFRGSGDELADTVAAYDSEIAFLDATLEEMFEHYGWHDNTVVALVSDHGEEFMDHGQIGHKFTLYPELTRVLLMIHGAGPPHAGTVDDQPAGIIDVLPTVWRLSGATSVSSAWMGRSLAARMAGERETEPRPFYAHWVRLYAPDVVLWSIVDDDWLLIDKTTELELYDLDRDFAATDDLATREPERFRAMHDELKRFRDSLKPLASGDVRRVTLDDETLEELESLGYVQ